MQRNPASSAEVGDPRPAPSTNVGTASLPAHGFDAEVLLRISTGSRLAGQTPLTPPPSALVPAQHLPGQADINHRQDADRRI